MVAETYPDAVAFESEDATALDERFLPRSGERGMSSCASGDRCETKVWGPAWTQGRPTVCGTVLDSAQRLNQST